MVSGESHESTANLKNELAKTEKANTKMKIQTSAIYQGDEYPEETEEIIQVPSIVTEPAVYKLLKQILVNDNDMVSITVIYSDSSGGKFEKVSE